MKRDESRLTDRERETTPLAREVAPEDAARMARHFAAVERIRIEALLRAEAEARSTDRSL